MGARSGAGPSGSPPPRRGNRLKDEVYRQMFRLEESRPGAELGLSLAVIRAWISIGTEPQCGEEREWLKKISPICLQMIENAMRTPGKERNGLL